MKMKAYRPRHLELLPPTREERIQHGNGTYQTDILLKITQKNGNNALLASMFAMKFIKKNRLWKLCITIWRWYGGLERDRPQSILWPPIAGYGQKKQRCGLREHHRGRASADRRALCRAFLTNISEFELCRMLKTLGSTALAADSLGSTSVIVETR